VRTAGDAAKLLGQPVAGPLVLGPEKDDDAPAQATHWTYRGATAAVVVSRLDFASPTEARKCATIAFLKKQHDDDDAKIAEEPGVGERAFWVTTGEGCAVTFLQGSHIGSVALGGAGLGPPAKRKAALKAAAVVLAGKL